MGGHDNRTREMVAGEAQPSIGLGTAPPDHLEHRCIGLTVNNDLPPELAYRLRQELVPGERILWQGKPSVIHGFTADLFPALGFILVLILLGWQVVKDHPQSAGPYDPGWDDLEPIFVLVGFGLVCSLLWGWWTVRRTAYAVTNLRAILLEGGWVRTVRSFYGKRLNILTRRDRWGSHGDIILERNVSGIYKGRANVREVGFFGVEKPQTVERLMRSIRPDISKAGNI